MTTPRENLAYAAGFIDTDGSITIARRPKQDASVRYSPIIAAKCVDDGPLEFLSDLFGCTVSRRDQSTRNSNLRRNFALLGWRAESRTAVEMAAQIAPFLLIKRAQAEMLVEFGCRPSGMRLTVEETMRRHGIHERVKFLNSRAEPVNRAPVWRGWTEPERHAYAAGVIDGDGHVTLRRYRNPPSHRGVAFSPIIGVRNADPLMLEMLRETFGGSVGVPIRSHPNLNVRLPTEKWTVLAQTAGHVARAVLPFAIAKRAQLAALVDFHDGCVWKPDGGRLSDEEFARREALHAHIAGRNRRDHLSRLS